MSNDARTQLLKSYDKDIRYDGRKLLDYRDVSVEYGVSKTAEGSAKITIGDTIVMAGVKMSVEKPYSDRPDEGTLMVNAELVPLSSPEFESGPPSIQAIELARVIDRGIRESHSIDVKKLCIEAGEKVWVVMIDIVSINDAGNLFDAASLAALAALRDAKLPNYNGEVVDYKHLSEESLPIAKQPLSITVHKLGSHLIVDPVSEEEILSDARLTVALTEDGDLCAMQKGGEYPLTADEVSQMVDIASEKTTFLRSKL